MVYNSVGSDKHVHCDSEGTEPFYHLSKTLHTLVESRPSSCPSLGNHWSVFCVNSFAFSRMSSKWSFEPALFYSAECIWDSSVLVCIFFLWLNGILWYRCTLYSLRVHQLKNILVCFQLLGITNTSAINICMHILVWT